MANRDKVRAIMVAMPMTRGDDIELIIQYFSRYYDIDLSAIRGMKSNEFASVCRYRQKVQQLDPTLRGTKFVSKSRETREKKWREEMRGL